MACSTRSARRTAGSGPSTSSHRMTNSSPPNRLTVSPGRSWCCSRSATSTSRRSPAECPRESLTTLKWSRSQNRTPTPRPRRRLRARARSSRSSSRVRLGSPVSGSWVASCSSRRSNALRSVMSRNTADANSSRPSPSRWASICASMATTSPSWRTASSSPDQVPAAVTAGMTSVRRRSRLAGVNEAPSDRWSRSSSSPTPKKRRAAAFRYSMRPRASAIATRSRVSSKMSVRRRSWRSAATRSSTRRAFRAMPPMSGWSSMSVPTISTWCQLPSLWRSLMAVGFGTPVPAAKLASSSAMRPTSSGWIRSRPLTPTRSSGVQPSMRSELSVTHMIVPSRSTTATAS